MSKKELTLKMDKKTILKELNAEIVEDHKQQIKGRVKDKMKQIRMAEITVMNLKKELDDMLSGKTVDEEELLFNDARNW